jgi:hypothetical protein
MPNCIEVYNHSKVESIPLKFEFFEFHKQPDIPRMSLWPSTTANVHVPAELGKLLVAVPQIRTYAQYIGSHGPTKLPQSH